MWDSDKVANSRNYGPYHHPCYCGPTKLKGKDSGSILFLRLSRRQRHLEQTIKSPKVHVALGWQFYERTQASEYVHKPVSVA